MRADGRRRGARKPGPDRRLLKRARAARGSVCRPAADWAPGSRSTSPTSAVRTTSSLMIDAHAGELESRAEVSGEAIVKFTIQRDGTITDAEVEKPSGYTALDIAALRAVARREAAAAAARRVSESVADRSPQFPVHTMTRTFTSSSRPRPSSSPPANGAAAPAAPPAAAAERGQHHDQQRSGGVAAAVRRTRLHRAVAGRRDGRRRQDDRRRCSGTT